MSQPGLATIALLGFLVASHGAAAETLTVDTRPGVTVKVDLEAPAGAKALVLLFDGGGGSISGGHKGFAAQAHRRLPGAGLASALIDAPSDQRGFHGGMHPKFRTTPDHLADIDAVLAALKARFDLPVWVMGVSLGTRSAAHYACSRGDRIAGLVVLSSSTASGRGVPVHEFTLQKVTVPLLAIAHRHDGCAGTPPEGAGRIVEAATASPAAETLILDGGRNSGRRPCGAQTYHTFFGIEDRTVAAIAGFVAAKTP